MNLNSDKRKKISFWVVGIATACILIFLGVQNIDMVAKAVSWLVGLVMPLILGVMLALIINVPMSFFEKHLFQKTKKPFLKKIRRLTAYIISLVIILGIIVGVFWLIIPELVEASKVIVQGITDYINKFSSMDKTDIAKLPIGDFLLNIDWNNITQNMQEWLKTQSSTIIDTAVGTVGTVVGVIYDFFVSFVFSIYILFNKEKLKLQVCRLIRAWLPKKFGGFITHAASVITVNFRNFISGQTLEAVILGTLCMIGMFILRIPYAPMVGTLIGVTALIPIVGAFIGTIVGAFMILTVNPFKAFVFIIFLLVLQQIEGNVIYPKVMGSRVNLPAMWILASVTVGGSIAGPVGMLLAVPTASSLYILLREATENREKLINKKELESNGKTNKTNNTKSKKNP